jgi:hypothetical protein
MLVLSIGDNPKITAGIVGYASKGELNKIIDNFYC